MSTIEHHIRPMLASPGQPPEGPGWAFEYKWDGARAIAHAAPGQRPTLISRLGNNITPSYPELGVLRDLLGERSVVLDGEIVALDDLGRPMLRLLQHRMQATPRPALLARIPVYYFVFDVLAFGGESMRAKPYAERRALLTALGLDSAQIRVPKAYVNVDGWELLRVALLHGLEGIVGKQLTSKYHPGARSAAWVKTLASPLLQP